LEDTVLKIERANIVTAFAEKTIGSKVTMACAFSAALIKAVEAFDFGAQRVPGQGLIKLPNEACAFVSAGVGKRVDDESAYVVRLHRGRCSAYLKREHAAPVEGVAVVVYTVAAYLADPDVAGDAAEVGRIARETPTHILVAVLAFAGPQAPLPPIRFVHNLAGGNKEALTWTADEIRAKAAEIRAYDEVWAGVAD
jgi:hypothetical protein